MRAACVFLWVPAALSIALMALPAQAGGQTGGWSIIGGTVSKPPDGRQERPSDGRRYDDRPFDHRMPHPPAHQGYWGDSHRSAQGERCGGGDRREQSRERRRR